jgi:hypothetical protein
MCVTLPIEPDDKTLNSGNVYDVQDVISACAGLVIINERATFFVLYTTRCRSTLTTYNSTESLNPSEEIAVAA